MFYAILYTKWDSVFITKLLTNRNFYFAVLTAQLISLSWNPMLNNFLGGVRSSIEWSVFRYIFFSFLWINYRFNTSFNLLLNRCFHTSIFSSNWTWVHKIYYFMSVMIVSRPNLLILIVQILRIEMILIWRKLSVLIFLIVRFFVVIATFQTVKFVKFTGLSFRELWYLRFIWCH